MKIFNISKRIILFLCIFMAFIGVAGCAEDQDRAPGDTVAFIDEQFTVLPLQTMTVVVTMEAGQVLVGYLTVKGGNDDIRVYVKDDFGEEIIDFGTVTGTRNIAYKSPRSGFYTIYFDNSFSVAVNKEITLHYSVR